MNNDLWKSSDFTLDSTPNWPCPTCNSGTLMIEKNSFHFNETLESIKDQDLPYWDPDYIRYRFTGFLKCSNCKDHISFGGHGGVSFDYEYDQFGQVEGQKYYDLFYPDYFNPALNLFKINKQCPAEVTSEIRSSFSLFWLDTHSCANKIRASLELLLNAKNIKKYKIVKKQRKRMPLHERIEVFKTKNEKVAEILLAIKWIGNSGSHHGRLNRTDVLEAYELLEHALDMLYASKDDRIKKIVSGINKNKGPRNRN